MYNINRTIKYYDSVQRSMETPRAPARSCAVGSRKREMIVPLTGAPPLSFTLNTI